MQVSYVYGVCVPNDAISNSIRNEMHWLAGNGANRVRLYANVCEVQGLTHSLVNSTQQVAFDRHFQESDLVVFHFGVYFELFDVVFVTPAKAKRLVVFHNVTPKNLLPVESHELIDRSFSQIRNICVVDHVACDSQTNLNVLQETGVRVPASVQPLAMDIADPAPAEKPSFRDNTIRIAFVGRLVRAKGPLELLDAADIIASRNPELRLHINLVGNVGFSDPSVVREIRRRISLDRPLGARLRIDLHGNAPDAQRNEILRDADLFVLPTYHEGFCVPILEALANGCKVVSYDNSNVPSISGGFAHLCPTGSVTDLAMYMEKAIAEVSSSHWRSGYGYGRYSEETARYVGSFSSENTRKRFLSLVHRLLHHPASGTR